VAISTTRLTIEDFEQLTDDEAYYKELVDGDLIDVSGNLPPHSRLRDYLVSLLLPLEEQQGIGMIISEQEFAFGEDAHGPDLALIGPPKVSLLDRGRRVQRFVPDLAIEIVSQNDTFISLMKKAAKYRKFGTREVWVFSQDTRQAFVLSEHRQAILGENDFFESPQIPGFRIRLGELFDRA
jgi:Uma2 family endonuclease